MCVCVSEWVGVCVWVSVSVGGIGWNVHAFVHTTMQPTFETLFIMYNMDTSPFPYAVLALPVAFGIFFVDESSISFAL